LGCVEPFGLRLNLGFSILETPKERERRPFILCILCRTFRQNWIVNVYREFITANRNLFQTLGAEESRTHLSDNRRRAIWLKEINDAILSEQAYLRVRVKNKRYD